MNEIGSDTSPIRARIVHLKNCKATSKAIDLIEQVARNLKLEIELKRIVIHSQEEAEKFRHIGGPTIQINDLDIDPEARNVKSFGLT